MDKPLYKPFPSQRKDKKMSVYVKGEDGKKKLIHFGDSKMEDFTQHRDKARRKAYLARSGGIRDANGRLTANNKNKANYWGMFLNNYVPIHTGAETIAKKYNMAVVFMDVQKIKRGYYEVSFVTITEEPKKFSDFEITKRFIELLERIHKIDLQLTQLFI